MSSKKSDSPVQLPLFICNPDKFIPKVSPSGVRFPVTRGRRGPGALRLQPRRHIARSSIARAVRAEERSLHPAMTASAIPFPDSDHDECDEAEELQPVKTAKVLYLRRSTSATETTRNEPAKVLSLAPYIGTRSPAPPQSVS